MTPIGLNRVAASGRRLIFLCACHFLLNFCHGQTIDHRLNLTLDRGSAECSIFEVAFLNSLGIHSGDVLVEIHTSTDAVRQKPDGDGMVGVFRSDEFRYRCVFDFESQRFLMVSQDGPIRHVDMADESDDSLETPVSYEGWIIDYPKELYLVSGHETPFPWRITGAGSLPDVLKHVGFLDPRISFHMPTKGVIDQKSGWVSLHASGKDFWKKDLKGDKLHLVLFDGTYVDGCNMRTWAFDAKKSLPLGYTEQGWHAEDKRFYPGHTVKVNWDVVDQYDIVSEWVWERTNWLESIDGKDYGGPGKTVVKLNWNSVNQKIDDRFFDGSVLKSVGSLRQCLEKPKKTNEPPAEESGEPKSDRSGRR